MDISDMRPRITVLTLGVDDLDRALAFYRDGLCLQTDGIVGKEFEHGAVAFFDLQAGVRLAIWERADIAHDAGLAVTAPSPTAFTIGHNVDSAQEVDADGPSETSWREDRQTAAANVGAGTRDTSTILTATSGRWSGTLRF